jgi:hypothetical protein
MAGKAVTIRVLLIEKPDGWIAQCLDYDIVAQAETFTDLKEELERVLVSHIAVSIELGREPFAGFDKAPQRWWDAYDRADTHIVENEEALGRPGRVHPALRITHLRQLQAI